MLTTIFDEPTRVKITLEDGTTREMVSVALEVIGTVKARRPPASAAEAPKNAGASEPVATKPDEAVTGAVARSWLKGEHDGDDRNAASLGVLLAVIGFLRRTMFKIEVATMTTNEAKLVRETLSKGAKPSTFCRAVVGASRDSFWIEQGDITVTSLVKSLGRLSKSGSAAR